MIIRVAECAYRTVISSKMDKNVCHRDQGFQGTNLLWLQSLESPLPDSNEIQGLIVKADFKY